MDVLEKVVLKKLSVYLLTSYVESGETFCLPTLFAVILKLTSLANQKSFSHISLCISVGCLSFTLDPHFLFD